MKTIASKFLFLVLICSCSVTVNVYKEPKCTASTEPIRGVITPEYQRQQVFDYLVPNYNMEEIMQQGEQNFHIDTLKYTLPPSLKFLGESIFDSTNIIIGGARTGTIRSIEGLTK